MGRTKDFDENEVLVKAVNIFWLKGYNGTSMQDLVDGLGISRSSLYDTYGDKHTLFIKALESYQCSASVQVSKIIDNASSAKKAVEQLLEFVIAGLLNDNERKGCFMLNAEVEIAPYNQDVNDLICRNDQQLELVFYSLIQKGQSNGEIANRQDARALARFIFNNVKGIRISAKSVTDSSFFDDIVKLTVSVLD